MSAMSCLNIVTLQGQCSHQKCYFKEVIQIRDVNI